jgi:DNA mismatch endonuclease (patch repair protein)
VQDQAADFDRRHPRLHGRHLTGVDFLTKEQRSRLMSRIRSVSKMELRARGIAERRAGCRLVHGTRKSKLPGSPDYYSKKNKVAVFVHGCYWHGCPRHYREPKSNVEFWRKKIARNRERDEKVRTAYEGLGWRVIVVWEHSVKNATFS